MVAKWVTICPKLTISIGFVKLPWHLHLINQSWINKFRKHSWINKFQHQKTKHNSSSNHLKTINHFVQIVKRMCHPVYFQLRCQMCYLHSLDSKVVCVMLVCFKDLHSSVPASSSSLWERWAPVFLKSFTTSLCLMKRA